MEENYLAKWLNGELSEQERIAFENSEEYAMYKRIAEESSLLQAPDFQGDSIWQNLQEERAAAQLATDNTDSGVIEMQGSASTHWITPFRPFLKIAAAIVVVISVSYLYFNSQPTRFHSELAQQVEVQLPDQSEVVLNAESSLWYHKKEWDTSRNLNLEGEAYFKVASGAKFTVQTSQGEIAVLGTEFNVRQRNGLLEVSCFEGKVQVQKGVKKLTLLPGQGVQILDGNWQDLLVKEGAQPGWMLEESSFSSVPLDIVFNELQRQFKIDVNSEGIDLNTLFSGSFSNTDLNLALESISIPTQLRYTRKGKKVLFYAKDTP